VRETDVETIMPEQAQVGSSAPRGSGAPTRTCVGCGARDLAAEMVHLIASGDVIAVDALFSKGGGPRPDGVHGRGAHLHARPACIARAPAGLSRSLRRPSGVTAGELGTRLVAACDRRMEGLLVSARRRGEVSVGADAAIDAARRGAPLVVVAVDAGTVSEKTEVIEAIAGGRCIAWRTKAELGPLLGEQAVAICAVRHGGIAAELKKVRAAADAGAAATREDARCRRPEAR
jgi:hypothetical protein